MKVIIEQYNKLRYKAHEIISMITNKLESLIRKHPIVLSLLVFTVVLIFIDMIFKGSIIDRSKESEGLISTLTATYWSAIIGGFISGGITLLGVLMSNHRQDQVFKETQRLSNMPVLHFEEADKREPVLYNFSNYQFEGDSEDIIIGAKEPIKLTIQSINPAFDLQIVESVTSPNKFEEGIENKSKSFVDSVFVDSEHPVTIHLDFNFDIEGGCAFQGGWRFQFSDVFGNTYYQDLIFEYTELSYDHIKTINNRLAPLSILMGFASNPLSGVLVAKNVAIRKITDLKDSIKYRLNNQSIHEMVKGITFHILFVSKPMRVEECSIVLKDEIDDALRRLSGPEDLGDNAESQLQQ